MSISPSGHFSGTRSGRQGSRTLISTRENRVSSAARQPGIRLPSVLQWTRRELNPDLRHARAVSSRSTTSPSYRVDRMGLEPTTPTLQGSVASWEHASPSSQRSVRESNPIFLLTEEVCCRNTYRPSSDPGRTRTVVFLAVAQASLPLDHGIISPVTEVGVEPTGTRLSTSPLCQFAYPVVAGPGVAPGGPGL